MFVAEGVSMSGGWKASLRFPEASNCLYRLSQGPQACGW